MDTREKRFSSRTSCPQAEHKDWKSGRCRQRLPSSRQQDAWPSPHAVGWASPNQSRYPRPTPASRRQHSRDMQSSRKGVSSHGPHRAPPQARFYRLLLRRDRPRNPLFTRAPITFFTVKPGAIRNRVGSGAEKRWRWRENTPHDQADAHETRARGGRPAPTP
jgi:hypothetical protein